MHELTNKNVANTQQAHLHICWKENKWMVDKQYKINSDFTKLRINATWPSNNKTKTRGNKETNKNHCDFDKFLIKPSLLVIPPIKFSMCLYISHRTRRVIQKVVRSRMWCDVECCGVYIYGGWCNYGWNHTATCCHTYRTCPSPPPKKFRKKGPKSWQWEKHARLYSDLLQALKGHFPALGSQQSGP